MEPSTVPENLNNPLNYKVIMMVFVAVFTFQIILYAIPESENEKVGLIISVVSIVSPLAVSIISFVIWSRYKGTKIFGRAYVSLGLAYFMVFAAEVTYFIYHMILQVDPYPSIADVFFFALYPFTMIHLILNIKFFKPKIFQSEKKWLVIIPIPIIIIYIFTSIFLIQEKGIEYHNSFDFIYGVLFITGSTITLALAFLGVKIFRESAMGTVWLLLVVGIFTNTIGDVWYYHLEIFEQYTLFHPVNVFWYSSYWLIVYALYKHREAI